MAPVFLRKTPLRTTLSVIATAAVIISSLLTPLLPSTAKAAPDDTPTPIVADSEFVEEWSVGAGLLDRGNNCFADEFNPFAILKRKPSAGGPERTLESINDGSKCITYMDQLSSTDGLYYFDDSQQRIARMPLSPPYTPKLVKALATNQLPNSGRAFVEAAGYLDRASTSNNVILRVRKNGSGDIETVATTGASPIEVMVVGNTIYWTDSTGVWTTSIACATLPCTGNQAQFAPFGAGTNGYGLLYQRIATRPIGSYRVYWVQQTSSGQHADFAIRYRACNDLVVCNVQGPISTQADPTSTLDDPITFYGSTTDWRIGNLVLANDNIYWTEADFSSVNNSNGDVKRRAYNATTPGADTIATGQANIDRRLYVADNLLFFARQEAGVYTLPLNASVIQRDLTMDGMEVTQAIQDLANDVPLVATKMTYVRAYGKQLSGPNAPNVEAWLYGSINGTPLPGSPLKAINGVRALATGGGYDRARLGDGWYFLLPALWTLAGPVTLQATIDPRGIHSDPNIENNKLTQTVTFQNQPPVCVWTVPVRTHTPMPSTNDPNFWSMVSHFNRRWPVPATWIFRDTDPVEELQVCWYGPFPYPCYGPYELDEGWGITNGIPDRDKVIVSLWGRAQLSFNPDACDDIGAPVHFMGMVHPDAPTDNVTGYASTISSESWVQLPPHLPNPTPPGWNMLREGSVMAQELAHNYGRKHVNCGNPENVDNGYPYPPCQIANVGPTSYYGFDATTLQPIRPDQTADFMSYASRSWVSDYTWRALFGSFLAAAQAAAATPDVNLAGDSVFVAGLVDTAHSRGRITQVLQLPTATVPPATRATLNQQPAAVRHEGSPDITYKLRLLDAGGAVLLERTLTLTPLDDHSPDSEDALFSDLFTPPAGQVAKIQLLAGSDEVDTITPGPNSPTAAVQQPASGALIDTALTIQWTASDPDPDDRLLFTVQYSHDNGASWHTLAVNLPSTPNPVNTYTVSDLGSLHGSAPNAARIRVLASDGYHTAIATSQPFTLKNRPPEPVITTPGAGQTYVAGDSVILQGSATDAEDGGLKAEALKWQLDSADVGAGANLVAAGLAPGTHAATLTATDANNQTGTATANFEIAPLSVPAAAAPLLDGRCDDAGYASGASVALKPYADDTQGSVRILRSDDALWVCFSGLKPGAPEPGSYAGLRIDVDNSRNAQAQSSDFGFFVGEDGAVSTVAGDGAGGLAAAGPDSLQAQVAADAGFWSAELRIDKTTVGGWDHLVSLGVGHHAVGAQGDDYSWPYAATYAGPNTWAIAAFGSQPVLTAIDPLTATVQGPAFTLAVEGSGFVSGTVALWNGAPLATTFVDGEHLTANVDAAKLAAAAVVPIKTRAPAPGAFESNALTFIVEGSAPAIQNLSPASVSAGHASFALTVNGSNFAPDAQVLWDGAPLATQFVNATQLNVQVDASLLVNGQIIGVAVRNQQPEERISPAAQFLVEPLNQRVFLPSIRK